MSFVLKVTPLSEDRISLYHRLNIPTRFEADSFQVAQQMALMLFDLYNFKETLPFQEEFTEYSIEGEGFLIEIEKLS